MGLGVFLTRPRGPWTRPQWALGSTLWVSVRPCDLSTRLRRPRAGSFCRPCGSRGVASGPCRLMDLGVGLGIRICTHLTIKESLADVCVAWLQARSPLQKTGVIAPGGPGSRLLLGAGIGVGPRTPQYAAVSPVSVDGQLGAQLSCPCRARRCRAGSAADAAGRTNLGRSCRFGMAFTCLTKASSTGKTNEHRWQAAHTHSSGGAAWRAAVARHSRLRVLINSCFLN